MSAVRGGERVLAGRVRLGAGLAISLALAGALCAIAFVGNGGLQLGSATLVEIGVIVVAGLVVAAALLFAADAPLHGGAALAALVALAGLTAPVDPVVAAPGRLVDRDQPHACLRGGLRGRDRGGAARARPLGGRAVRGVAGARRS